MSAERDRLRAELSDGAGNAPPDWYLDSLIADREAVQVPDVQPDADDVRSIRPKHVGHVLEWVRTLVPCAVLVVQLLILYRQ